MSRFESAQLAAGFSAEKYANKGRQKNMIIF